MSGIHEAFALPEAYEVRKATTLERRNIYVVNERCTNHITLQRVWNALLDSGYLDGVYSEAKIASSDSADPWSVLLCMIDATDPGGVKRRFVFLGGTPGQSSSCELSVNVLDEELQQQIKAYTMNYTLDESSEPNPFE